MIERMIEDVLRREGGSVNHAADRGGPTNYGITRKTLEAWRGQAVTADDVRRLGKDEARALYHERYYRAPGIDTLPVRIQPQLFDMAVNHGPTMAVRLLQQALVAEGYGPLPVDGGIGPATRAASEAAARTMGGRLNTVLVDGRIAFYRNIVARTPAQKVFLAGWLRRAEEFREET